MLSPTFKVDETPALFKQLLPYELVECSILSQQKVVYEEAALLDRALELECAVEEEATLERALEELECAAEEDTTLLDALRKKRPRYSSEHSTSWKPECAAEEDAELGRPLEELGCPVEDDEGECAADAELLPTTLEEAAREAELGAELLTWDAEDERDALEEAEAWEADDDVDADRDPEFDEMSLERDAEESEELACDDDAGFDDADTELLTRETAGDELAREAEEEAALLEWSAELEYAEAIEELAREDDDAAPECEAELLECTEVTELLGRIDEAELAREDDAELLE
ncbi:hypothetical protein B0H11DRAFT_2214602 [Mycena galericulata]|nr:hypothetical protein B0H11DRAFT_2214602 [Mycena galericulata]